MKTGIAFDRCDVDREAGLWEDYVAGIAVPYDDYLENRIIESDLYAIRMGGDTIGLLGVRGNMATLFHVPVLHQHHAFACFKAAREIFGLEEAFVPTTDLGFLAVALEIQRAVDIQACHFEESGRAVSPPNFPKECLRPAIAADHSEIVEMAGDFLDDWQGRIRRGEIFLLADSEEIAGLGVLVPNRIMPGCVGTGMFTRASRRGEGVGRSIILHLRDICHERGLRPVPGCWYHNTASRATLESSGYVCRSMLLRISLPVSGRKKLP